MIQAQEKELLQALRHVLWDGAVDKELAATVYLRVVDGGLQVARTDRVRVTGFVMRPPDCGPDRSPAYALPVDAVKQLARSLRASTAPATWEFALDIPNGAWEQQSLSGTVRVSMESTRGAWPLTLSQYLSPNRPRAVLELQTPSWDAGASAGVVEIDLALPGLRLGELEAAGELLKGQPKGMVRIQWRWLAKTFKRWAGMTSRMRIELYHPRLPVAFRVTWPMSGGGQCAEYALVMPVIAP